MKTPPLIQRARVSVRYRGKCLAQRATVAWHDRFPNARPEGSFVILDDYFPNLLTGFRIAEFNYYLEADPRCQVYSSDRGFRTHLAAYQERFPHLAPQVARWHPFRYMPGELAYLVFLHNAHSFLPMVERRRLPFVFTLYPGGGFRLEDNWSDWMLRRVCQSPCFRKVIVTQTISRDYLLDGQYCRPDQIEMIYGGVFPSDVFSAESLPKQRYGIDKETLDLCFVAHKYMPQGIDKGYDVFLEVARLLIREAPKVRFHVIGGFGPDEIDVSDLEERITFHGSLYRDDCRRLYAGMDLILSPNVPFRLFPGSFDGFPTGCCIEAGLSGVAVFCTDPLGSNIAFKDGEEIVIIPREPHAIADVVASYLQQPARLYALAMSGQQAFARVFDLEAQMAPRRRVLGEAVVPR